MKNVHYIPLFHIPIRQEKYHLVLLLILVSIKQVKCNHKINASKKKKNKRECMKEATKE